MTELTHQEQTVYDMICAAIQLGKACPSNHQIESKIGYSSTSMGSVVIAKLEEKGAIEVRRFQRFRQVKDCASGKWTRRSRIQNTERLHVPRGKKNYPSDRKPYRMGVS